MALSKENRARWLPVLVVGFSLMVVGLFLFIGCQSSELVRERLKGRVAIVFGEEDFTLLKKYDLENVYEMEVYAANTFQQALKMAGVNFVEVYCIQKERTVVVHAYWARALFFHGKPILDCLKGIIFLNTYLEYPDILMQ